MITKQYFENLKRRSEFKFWFEQVKPNVYTIIDQVTNPNEFIQIGTFNPVTHEYQLEVEADPLDIISNFGYFQTRPEYEMSREAFLDPTKVEDMINMYETRLFACILTKYEKRFDFAHYEDYAWSTFDASTRWLRQSDFYQAPASTQYHDSFHGGLLYHTLKVYNEMLDMRNINKYKDIPYDSMAIVSLVHDWCKIGLYEPYQKNVKNEQTGKWEKQLAYRHNQAGAPLGHGATSMFLASRFFTSLTLEEACAIRWHMGEYNVADNEMNELHRANHSFPLVYAIQFADRLACVEY